jgi:hypothetical protein
VKESLAAIVFQGHRDKIQGETVLGSVLDIADHVMNVYPIKSIS